MNETTMNILISMSIYIREVGDFHIFIGVDKLLSKEGALCHTPSNN